MTIAKSLAGVVWVVSAAIAGTAWNGQGEGPCALLTTGEVQRAFPGAKPGTLDRSQEQYGNLACLWDYPTGRLSIIEGKDAPGTVADEAKGWTLMFLDPLNRGAARHVRYERLSGIGDEAMVVVERADKSKGFIGDGAVLVVRRGKRQISAMVSDLARRDRAEALKVLEQLGQAIAKRME